jgi:hypothetical protein
VTDAAIRTIVVRRPGQRDCSTVERQEVDGVGIIRGSVPVPGAAVSNALVTPRSGITPTLLAFVVLPGGHAFNTVAGGTSAGDQNGPLGAAIVLGLLVILAVGAIALLTGNEQAEERPSPAIDAPDRTIDPPAPAFVWRAATNAARTGGIAARPGRRAAWEVSSSLENEPLGTVNELLAPPPAVQERSEGT